MAPVHVPRGLVTGLLLNATPYLRYYGDNVDVANVAPLIEDQVRQIGELLPAAEIYLSGAALVDGADATDFDLVVLVDDVRVAASRLCLAFPPLYETEWRDDWAAFRHSGPPQVDIVVTRAGTKGDAHHRRAWQLLLGDSTLLAEYHAMRASTEDYEERKAAFFERVVALLPADLRG